MRSVKILIVILLLGVIVGIKIYKNKIQFPPKNNACFTDFVDVMNTGLVDPEWIFPKFDLTSSNGIFYFRCAVKFPYEQFEILGNDITGKLAHVYFVRGGMAASGADSIFDYCYKDSEGIVIGEHFEGRDNPSKVATCAWRDDVTARPDSSYLFSRKRD